MDPSWSYFLVGAAFGGAFIGFIFYGQIVLDRTLEWNARRHARAVSYRYSTKNGATRVRTFAPLHTDLCDGTCIRDPQAPVCPTTLSIEEINDRLRRHP